LSVIGGERNGENIVGVSDKSAGGGTGGKLPKAESLVPGGRESVGTVRGDDLIESQYSIPQYLTCQSTTNCRRTYAVRDNV
jgi:hypothetical protein